MSLKTRKVGDQSGNENATYLIYGGQGVGKTSSIRSIPGKTLLIDIDKSSSVLEKYPNEETSHITVVEIDTHNIYEEWLGATKEIISEKMYEGYDNIIVDNVSELFRSTLANLGRIGKNNRVPAMSDYQRVDFTILDSLRALSNLPTRLIFTAWEKSDQWESENGQSFNRAFPDLRNTIMNNFLGLCDVVAHLVVIRKEDEDVRGFILQPTNSVTAKNRLDDRGGAKIDELVKVGGDDE